MEYDDAFSIGCLGLIRAARTYNSDRGSFTTVAALNINQALSHEVRAAKAQKRTSPGRLIYLDQPVCDDITIGDSIPAPDLSPEDAYDIADLAARYSLLYAYYVEGRTQAELAAILGIAQPSVSKRIIAQLNAARLELNAART
jgi:DNA-directed RNA polymerase specialized sigma subunit